MFNFFHEIFMNTRKWITATLFSLLFVAILGLLLRYKIAFSLPFINQKYLQFGHSHFAMTGWFTQLLIVLLASSVSKTLGTPYLKKYTVFALSNIITSYAMLAAFLYQGYGSISIIFSVISMVVMVCFGVQLWRDMNKSTQPLPGFIWFRAAVIFSILASLGVVMLVYLKITRNMDINIQQATTYFYLHFQYNGWLVFACFGLLINMLSERNVKIRNIKPFFWCYSVACIPAYFLSVLWLPIPSWLYIIIIISAFIIAGGWIWFIVQINKQSFLIFKHIPSTSKLLFGCSALAYTIKVVLQLGSTIPSLNNLAFGYRPIVIGYLHLVFLGVITLFILGYLIYADYLKPTKWVNIGVLLFIIGIILNELMLMMQGLMAMGYYNIPYINEILVGVTALMLLGIIGINMRYNNDSFKATGRS